MCTAPIVSKIGMIMCLCFCYVVFALIVWRRWAAKRTKEAVAKGVGSEAGEDPTTNVRPQAGRVTLCTSAQLVPSRIRNARQGDGWRSAELHLFFGDLRHSHPGDRSENRVAHLAASM